MRAAWILVALVGCASCGEREGERSKVTRFTDDRGRPAVGVRPDAAAPRVVEVLKAALAEAPEVAVVALEGTATREVCTLKAAPPRPPADPHAIQSPPPVLSILVEPTLVWYGISRINEYSMSAPIIEAIRAVGGSMAKDQWFEKDRVAELAFRPEVGGAMVITVIEALCPSWSSFHLLEPAALTSRPEPPPPAPPTP